MSDFDASDRARYKIAAKNKKGKAINLSLNSHVSAVVEFNGRTIGRVVSDQPDVTVAFLTDTQYPSIQIGLSTGTIDDSKRDVICHIFPQSIATEGLKDNKTNMTGLHINTPGTVTPDNMEQFKYSHYTGIPGAAQAGLLWTVDLLFIPLPEELTMPSRRPGIKFTGISALELLKIFTQYNNANEREKMPDWKFLVAYLALGQGQAKLSILKTVENTEARSKDVETVKQFKEYFIDLMAISSRNGNMWFYHRQAPSGMSLSDNDFPLDTLDVPGWLATEWSNEELVSKPSKWLSVNPILAYPDRETVSFTIRLALHRERQALQALTVFATTDQPNAMANFLGYPDLPDKHIVTLKIIDFHAEDMKLLPPAGTKITLNYRDNSGPTHVYRGTVFEETTEAHLHVYVRGPPPPNGFNEAVEYPVKFEMASHEVPMARCINAVDILAAGSSSKERGVDFSALLGYIKR
ncbi:uncharacterized protein K452DRAFT_308155 [Aplosporella prunicola CBS 121167]|uniref:Uncharacterized protein n=1 Tax=Aplosporella prunicola CBS 121167 TaxID=1176127 RepID=A0A6A6BIW9_9PEZI|nr:uncharacterized protein K452DRAFT_308155 [Aplosporella prunicola CBS 121167]KAF2142501.1 hypothetical protein K452DRAFT_308155 [Aplosporella prunicola CBS 121167]